MAKDVPNKSLQKPVAAKNKSLMTSGKETKVFFDLIHKKGIMPQFKDLLKKNPHEGFDKLWLLCAHV